MKNLWLAFILLLMCLPAFSQEANCGDGIDNDGDGFIDCFDGDCANNSVCKDFYVGKDKICQAPPVNVPQFELKTNTQSPDRTTDTYGRMVIGDLDRDGIPEVVVAHQEDKKLYILSGSDLSIKYSADITATPEYYDYAIANINDDDCAEIFIAEKSGSSYYVTSFDCQGNQLWRTKAWDQPFDLGLADFDQDGKVELYYRNEMLDANDGTRLIKGSGSYDAIDAGPVAVDIIDSNPGLELVLGGYIYGVNLGARTADAGSLTLLKSIPNSTNGNRKYYPKYGSGGYVGSQTSIADYNQDGYLDVLVSGAAGSTGGATTVYFWDVQNNKSIAYQPANNWSRGTGRLNIADIDGDGKLNTTFVTGSRLYALKEDFTLLWVNTSIVEATSGITGTTVFDFNNDGANETVYRDESYLYIIDGTTGNPFTQVTCHSRTANEYPIVADVDGDGATEICVICNTNDGANINTSSNTPLGQVRTYKSNLEPWVPARKLWNQHGYFNVNVNDDLTIPRVQQKHHLVFSSGVCTPGDNRPLNTFLNQSAFLDSKGCPTYASPDIIYEPNTIAINAPTCPDQNFTVSFTIKNSGDLGLSGTLPITFYAGDPRVAGATKLNTVNINLTNFNVDDTYAVTNMTVQGTGGNFTLYAVLNDNGSTIPPISLPNTGFLECDYDNNIISAPINPAPFDLNADKLSDNIKCAMGPTADNGAAEAYKLTGGVKETVNYNFYWFSGATVGDTTSALFKGPVITGLADGTYSVFAVHKGYLCSSNAAQVTIALQAKTVNAGIIEDTPFSNCKNPNGKMHVEVTGSSGTEPFGNYTYEWYKGNQAYVGAVLSTSHVITNVDAVTYTVVVTEKATGCITIVSGQVTDQTVKPTVAATPTDAKCNPPNSGSASANVGGTTTGYTFDWYNGSSVKPSADFTGATYSNLTTGNYVVVATKTSSGCTSSPLLVTVGSSTVPTVTANVTAHQTSCAGPNGAASANVGGVTAGFTFKWYTGNDTLAVNLKGTGASITGLAAGLYTVKAINSTSGCFDTETITINNNIVMPTVNASVVSHQTNCSPFNGSVTAVGAGSTGPYDYYWFNGNVGSPDTTAYNFKGANYTGRQAGFYTVLAVDRITRCAAPRAVVQVLDNTVLPTITTSTVNQTSCNPGTPNGQASADVGGNTSNFNFTWYAGAGTGGAVVGNTPAVTNLAAGTYTVQAITIATGCPNTKQVTVVNSPVNPALTQTILSNASCAGSLAPTGSITLQVNGGADPITDFTIEWFEGNGTTTPLGTTVGNTSGTNNEKADALTGGTYTVRVTDNVAANNSCVTTTNFTVNSTPPAITIDNPDVGITPSSDCSPGNGSITVSEITVNGTGTGTTAGYSFTWLQSDGVTAVPGAGNSAAIAVPLATGNYFVKATNTVSNCSSPITAVNVPDTHVNPVTAPTITDNSNCGGPTPNGSITVNVNGGAPLADFNIEWFEGNGTTTALGTTVGTVFGANNETAQELSAGNYTVRVTDNATPGIGCVTTTTFTVNNNLAVITIDNPDIALTHNSNCSPGNGSATVNEITVNGAGLGNTTGYTFEWLQNDGITAVAGGGNAATVGSGLTNGNYFVRATNSLSNCKSPITPFTINDIHVNPAATTTVVNNTNCSGPTPNGSVTITQMNAGTDPLADFTFEWFEGNGTTTSLGTTKGSVGGANNEIAQDLPAGTYTLRITDNIAPNQSCVTTTTFTINDVLAVVTIDNPDIALIHNSNCSPGNGSATVNEITVNGAGLGNTTGYTFEWLQSDGTTPVAGGGNAATVGSGLTNGNYFVRATNSLSNCKSPITPFTINDIHVNPAATTTVVNNTNCSGATPNGSVTITQMNAGVDPLADFTFEWFEGNGTTTLLGTTKGSVGGTNNEKAQDLPAGTYTLRITDNTSPNQSCATTTTFTINDVLDVVTIDNPDIALTHNSNCSPVNGSATVNEITVNGAGLGNTTGYTFEWLQSDGTTAVAGGGNAATIGTTIASGNYFVRATNSTTKCKSPITPFTINDIHVNPTATTTVVNNTNCSGATPNGSVTITQMNAGADPLSDFIFEWFEGNTTTTSLGTTKGSVGGANDEIAQDLPAGTYTVRITDNVLPSLNCVTITTFTINNNLPVITIDNPDITPTPNSNCTPANGSASVSEITINGIGTGSVAGYTFEWLQSDGTTPVAGGGNAATVSAGLVSGNYFVRATNSTSSCKSPITLFAVNDTHVDPVITTAVPSTDNTNCSNPPNGSITIQMNGGADPVTDYMIEWFEGNGTTTTLGTNKGSTAGANGETAQEINGGTYTVRVTDNNSPNQGCTATASFSIIDNLTYPVPNGVPSANTACDPAKSNGTILADVGGSTVGYTFDVFDGQNTNLANRVSTTPLADSLHAGIYTVKATIDATGCSATTEVNVVNNIVLPQITATASANVTNCATPDGTASVTGVSIGALADYTFSWYDGNGLKASPDYPETGAVLNGLLAANYTVTGFNNVLGCDVQAPATITVNNDPSTAITITEIPGEQIIPAICNDGQGQIGVQASSPVNALGFAFNWFNGDKNTGMTAEGNGQDFPVNSNRISQAASGESINSGLHTVIVLDKTTGCQDSLSINLPYSDEAALLSILTSPQTDCLTPDGGFDATITPSAGTIVAHPLIDQTWYRIEVYQNGALIATAPGTDPSTVVGGLATGNYTVIAVETDPSLNGCTSAPNDINIADNTVYPVIAANAIIDNKNCIGAASGTGSIALEIDGVPTPPAGYTYAWYDGKLTSDPPLPPANVTAPGHTAINIDGGFYTVEVTSAANNCTAKETLNLNNDPHIISIASADLSLTDQTDCSPDNGAAEVTNVSIDGVPSGIAGFTYQWLESDGASTILGSSTTELVGTPIGAGDYFVKATDNTSNCVSPIRQFTINNVSTPPAIAMTASLDNTNCVGATPNGEITIEINSGEPVADFTINWFEDAAMTVPLGTNFGNVLTPDHINELPKGTYYVSVVDNTTPNATCSSTASFSINDDLPVITIATADITVTDQTDCVPNGTAQVNDIIIDGVSNAGIAGFNITWQDDLGAIIDGPNPGNAITIPLAAGDYRVIATNTTSNCSSLVTPFSVLDVSTPPAIAMTASLDNKNCVGATPNGEITIEINSGEPVADFTINWFEDAAMTVPLGTNFGNVFTPDNINQLPAGTYYVAVTDNTTPGNTCSSTASFSINDDLPVITIATADIAVTDQTDCVPNGTAQVNDIIIDGVSNAGIAGFNITWQDDLGATIDGPNPGNAITIPLAAGDYRVIATNTTSNCSSLVTPFSVLDVSTPPAIAMTASLDNTNCLGATPNGEITIEINSGEPVADFTINWFEDAAMTVPLGTNFGNVFTPDNINQLPAGTYYVAVTDNTTPGNTCSSTASFSINDDLPVITIATADIAVTDQTDCVPNGTAQVNDIIIDGVSNAGIAGFNITWQDDLGATIDGPNPGNAITIPLAAGDYRVIATNTTSNCSSLVTPFSVLDVSTPPAIAMTASLDNTNCLGATPNGEITIEINSGEPVADFTINWFEDAAMTVPLGTNFGNVFTPDNINQLPAGTYYVAVTDNTTPGNTCSSTASFSINDDLPVITIATADIAVTDQTDCVPNGTAQVNDIIIDGVSNAGIAGFNITWQDDLGATIDGPNPGNAITIPLAAGDYRVIATNTTSNCNSLVTPFSVLDVSTPPAIAMTASLDNTNCVGATPNGEITIEINSGEPVADFTINWFEDAAMTVPLGTNFGNVFTPDNINQLPAGTYYVAVTDNTTPNATCSSTASFSINDDLPVITIATADIAITDQTDCVPNGTAQVNDIIIDGVSNAGIAGFNITWQDDLGATIDGPNPGNAITIPLAAGDYRVIATNTTSNCSSLVTPFSVLDVSTPPAIAMTASLDNTNCLGATPNGEITIEINNGEPLADFTIDWFEDAAMTIPLGTNFGTVASTDHVVDLPGGTYYVAVTDNTTPNATCASATFFSINDNPNVVGVDPIDIAITDNADCTPVEGGATVSALVFNGTSDSNTGNYAFDWFENDGSTPVAGAGNGPVVAVTLQANDYFVQATHTSSNCISPLVPFTVKDLRVTPTIVIVQDFPNIACNASYTGQLSASVSEGTTSGVTAGYQFDWYTGANNTNPADFIASGTSINNLQEGDYTVQVTDLASPGLGCIGTATITLTKENPVLSSFVSVQPQTQCAPGQDGQITVTTIQQDLMGTTTTFDMSNPADLANFSFQWFDESMTPITGVINGSASSPTLLAGTYYVEATNPLGCTSILAQGVVDDLTVHPGITVDDFDNPTVCILPETLGRLSIIPDNTTNFSDYTFEWHEGASIAGLLRSETGPVITDIAYSDPLTYTVRVTKNSNNCFTDATYTFKPDTIAIKAIAGAVPVTSCLAPNGGLYVAVEGGNSNLYNIEWYFGQGISGGVEFNTTSVNNAPIGFHTVIAKHPTLNFCTSIPDTTEVASEKFYPPVSVTLKSNLTYCDPAKPNGTAKAEVNGQVIGYTFDWYRGAETGPHVYTGSEYGSLYADTYFVTATDVVSGCDSTVKITIIADPLIIPKPLAMSIPRTDCVNLNGELAITGVTNTMLYSWYNGGAVKATPDATGENYSDLDAGPYTVTATDMVSGCVSDPLNIPVEEIYVLPEFDVKTFAATCSEANGKAELIVLNASNIQSIEWDINGVYMVGPIISDLPAGENYHVTATTPLHCTTTKDFIVNPDITVFNGISKNNDGNNDYFEIGCIENFPNNTVRIFNRAGTLVYEAKHYDNQDTFFNGVSNRGINILGNELPDGTYFYIIDKSDGSEPKTGYLELLH